MSSGLPTASRTAPFVTIAATATPDRTYAARYQAEPRQIVEPVAFEVALLERGWPHDDAERMTDAAEQCESPARDASGTPIGIDLWSRVVDLNGYVSIGPGINLRWHPTAETDHDLTTLAGMADEMTDVRTQAVAMIAAHVAPSNDPLWPWNCVTR